MKYEKTISKDEFWKYKLNCELTRFYESGGQYEPSLINNNEIPNTSNSKIEKVLNVKKTELNNQWKLPPVNICSG